MIAFLDRNSSEYAIFASLHYTKFAFCIIANVFEISNKGCIPSYSYPNIKPKQPYDFVWLLWDGLQKFV